jgi:hypothetical protein
VTPPKKSPGLVLFLLLLGLLHLHGQVDTATLWQKYLQGELDVISAAAEDIRASEDSDERLRFLRNLFVMDGKAALATYEDILNSSKDGQLRYQAAKKIYAYYFALGFYVTADEMRQRFGLDKEIISGQPEGKFQLPPLQYVVQLGAFSQRENAERMIQRISKADFEIMIKPREISGRTLFLVWVGPYSNAETARQAAEVITDKYHINTTIKAMD